MNTLRSEGKWVHRTLLATLVVGVAAVTVGGLSGHGPAVGLPVFLGLQQLAMAWARTVSLREGRVWFAATAAAGIGVVLQWAVARFLA